MASVSAYHAEAGAAASLGTTATMLATTRARAWTDAAGRSDFRASALENEGEGWTVARRIGTPQISEGGLGFPDSLMLCRRDPKAGATTHADVAGPGLLGGLSFMR